LAGLITYGDYLNYIGKSLGKHMMGTLGSLWIAQVWRNVFKYSKN